MAGLAVRTCFLLVVFSMCAESRNVTLDTRAGTFIGSIEEHELDGVSATLSKFLGIPYAEPPVGQHRFRYPQPMTRLREPWDATEYGSPCLAVTGKTDDLSGSEDCLFLNVFAPETNGTESLAVMVFIHGGAFVGGSSNDYNSEFLALYGHVIVVTVNYRLSVWGFLCTGNGDSSGNYGLWDQRMAIEWVSENIDAFHGDASRITIFGESAGGASVGYQALYPDNKGLFSRVITQSGSPAADWALSPKPQEDAVQLASLLNCDTENMAALVSCVRNVPVEVLNTIINNKTNSLYPKIHDMFKPCVDHIFVTDIPNEMLDLQSSNDPIRHVREAFASFDFMTGTISGDGSVSFLSSVDDVDNFLPNRQEFEDQIIPNSFIARFRHNLTRDHEEFIRESIIAEYTVWEDPENSEKIRDQVVQMYSDADFLAPQEKLLNVHATSSTKGTYVYYFDAAPYYRVIYTPSWFTKPGHADEMAYLFPPIAILYSGVISDNHVALAVEMVTMWANFAKTGDPNQPRDVGKDWVPYTPSRHAYLEITGNPDTDSVKAHLREGQTHFWNKMVPMIISMDHGGCEDQDNSETSGSQISPIRRIEAMLLVLSLWTVHYYVNKE